MNYNKFPKHSIIIYRNLLDHIEPYDVLQLNNFKFDLKKLTNYKSSNHVIFLYSLFGGRIWVSTTRLILMEPTPS